MQKIRIKQKEKIAIIESLKVGIVPRIGLRHIQVGRINETKEIYNDFQLISQGLAKVRFIMGDYGSGKSFFLTLSKIIAHEENFVVLSADITTDKLLCSRDGKSQKLFKELISNMSTKTKPEGDALRTVIEKWASKTIQKFGGNITEEIVYKELRPLEKLASYSDFSKVLYTYIKAYENDDEIKMSYTIKWFRAEYSKKNNKKKDLEVRTIICDENVYEYLKLFAEFVHLAGYNGLIVNIDELAVLARQRSNIRDKNFERILNIINDTAQNSCEYIEFILGGTTRFLEDEIKGLYSYEALKQRLIGNPFAVYEKKDLSRPVILLEKLTKEELFQLFKNIRNVFAEYDETKYLVTNNEIEKFMQYLFNRFGANSFLTPRESIRQFIGLLTQIQNNPNIKFNDLLINIVIKKDIEEEFDEDDEELTSLDF